ncbi:LytTR family DNA-binding domain-containing protein [uncultured Chitinophaga sp.]|jgi:Response regulator of the LytR/AlgR family|uniref:LytR/AlgR family response regulator transcription factor n=1 Tax=uncultured Chitinophaga sp. TaxID=339340 RepID=UPI00261215AE|nr:response regulator transcription factor [uncultured Chitinophaga sp.]
MIRCLAVDDELLSLDLLEDNIRQVPFLQLVGRCSNAFEAIATMQKEPVDLLFLDIQMPGLTGTQFLQSLPNRPMVIFITAYKKYALEGFELDVLDYLIKPVPFERFMRAVNKAAEYLALKQTPAPAAAAETVQADYFFVNVEYNLVKVVISDISHIEGWRDYIKIYCCNEEKPLIARLAIKVLADRLPPGRFVRVHKSYIVAVDKIAAIRKNRIFIGRHIIPVSDSHRDQLFTIIGPQNIK